MNSVQAAIALGSNLADPVAQLDTAIERLTAHPLISVESVSGYYRSAPQGDIEQPEYVNACALIRTALDPYGLLDVLQEVKQAMGKRKRGHWQPREIDLDLLTHGGAVIQSDRLTVPHPWLHRRDFVLVPLAEIAPDLQVPGYGRVQDLLESLSERFILERL